MNEAEQVSRIARAILADWRQQHPGASNGAAALAGVGAVRIAHVALREMRAMQHAAPDEADLRETMRDPAYWRDRDPALVDRVVANLRSLGVAP